MLNVEEHLFEIAQWRDSLTDDHGCPCWNDHRPKEVLEMLARWEEALNEVVCLREQLTGATASERAYGHADHSVDANNMVPPPMPEGWEWEVLDSFTNGERQWCLYAPRNVGPVLYWGTVSGVFLHGQKCSEEQRAYLAWALGNLERVREEVKQS